MRKRVTERRTKTTPSTPPGLVVYAGFGVRFINQTGDEMRAECPVCQREKFYIHVEKGLCHCKHGCELRNPIDFIRWLWEESDNNTTVGDRARLATHRGLDDP